MRLTQKVTGLSWFCSKHMETEFGATIFEIDTLGETIFHVAAIVFVF
jgi:hypothetical protein